MSADSPDDYYALLGVDRGPGSRSCAGPGAHEVDDRPPEPDASRVAAHGDTALFFGCRDVDAAYKDLRAAGITLKPPTVAPYGMKQLYLKDPDGYEICLQWRAEEGA